MAWEDLILCPKGKWSRTQATIILLVVFNVILITLEVIFGNIITKPVLIADGGLFLFVLFDRWHTRHLEFKIGKAGLEIAVKGDTVNSDKVSCTEHDHKEDSK